jgi:hypothetical protein
MIRDKKASALASKCSNNAEQMAFLDVCAWLWDFEEPIWHLWISQIVNNCIVIQLLTESCMASCRLVMHRSARIMSSARCNMSLLLAVAGRPDRGWSCSSVSPLPEALTLWTGRTTVLLSTAQINYASHNLLWIYHTISFSATKNSITAHCV